MFSVTDINIHDFRNLLKHFNNSPYLGYKSKQVKNEPTESYFFLTKQIIKTMKIKKQVQILTNFLKLVISKKIEHVNETSRHVNKALQYEELENNNNNKTTMFADKYKQTSSAYNINDEENTSSTSEKK